MRLERAATAPDDNRSEQLSREVEQVLEHEIGRSEILAGVDALLEEGIAVRNPEDILRLMKPFVHEEFIGEINFPPQKTSELEE